MLPSERYEITRLALSANVTRLRERNGWTQQQAAEAMGLDVKHLQKLEYGQLNPSLRTLVNIAEAFGISVGRLLGLSHSGRAKRPVGRPRKRRSAGR
jgi:transcriptional regulator with XRE-family HTH domain